MRISFLTVRRPATVISLLVSLLCPPSTLAAEGAVITAKSEYYPKLALTGELHGWWNGGFKEGMATPQNRAGWIAGFGIEIPLLNGFLTRDKVTEARARVSQLKETRILMREGLGLQIKDLFLGLECYASTIAQKPGSEPECDSLLPLFSCELSRALRGADV